MTPRERAGTGLPAAQEAEQAGTGNHGKGSALAKTTEPTGTCGQRLSCGQCNTAGVHRTAMAKTTKPAGTGVQRLGCG